MPRKFLGQIAPEEASIRLRSNGQEFQRDGDESTNGYAQSNGHALSNGHSSAHGAA
jgi:hypothetical protein